MSEFRITTPEKGEWNDFVKACNGSIFQLYEMKEVYDRTKNYRSLLLAVKGSNEIKAGMLAELRDEKPGFLGFATRAVVEGGPLYSEKEALKALIREYDKLVKGKAVFSQFFNLHEMSDANHALAEEGYSFEDELNYLISLEKSEGELFSGIHKSRRKNIKKAEGKVNIVKMEKEQLPVFYNLVKATLDRARVPVADISLYESAFEILKPKGMAHFYLAEYDREFIGARAVLDCNGVIYDWAAGASEKHLDLFPNDILVWHILKSNAGKRKYFDFQGAGKPGSNYGPGEFKRRFGGKEVNYGRFKKIISPVKNKVTMAGFKIYQKIKWR